YGDGVNIAARLEKLAEPGSVCIGRNVYDRVKGKLAYVYTDLGEQRVHNIPEAVHAYRVTAQSLKTASVSCATEQPKFGRSDGKTMCGRVRDPEVFEFSELKLNPFAGDAWDFGKRRYNVPPTETLP